MTVQGPRKEPATRRNVTQGGGCRVPAGLGRSCVGVQSCVRVGGASQACAIPLGSAVEVHLASQARGVPTQWHTPSPELWFGAVLPPDAASPAFFRIIKNQRGGGPLPQNPLPPSPDQSDHRGKKRNLQEGKSGQAIFGTPSFGSKTPSPPPPCSKEALPPAPHCALCIAGGFCRFDRLTGNFAYGSYRDPNLLSTVEV